MGHNDHDDGSTAGQEALEWVTGNIDNLISAWEVTFVESLAGRKWVSLTDAQQGKLEEIREDLDIRLHRAGKDD